MWFRLFGIIPSLYILLNSFVIKSVSVKSVWCNKHAGFNVTFSTLGFHRNSLLFHLSLIHNLFLIYSFNFIFNINHFVFF